MPYEYEMNEAALDAFEEDLEFIASRVLRAWHRT